MILMFTTGSGISWLDVIMVGLVVFFLSLGAPNQPGSILIGLLVIFNYMDALDIIALAIYAEAIFGSLLSVTNAAGDIVTIAITDKYEKAHRKAISDDEGEYICECENWEEPVLYPVAELIRCRDCKAYLPETDLHCRRLQGNTDVRIRGRECRIF